MTTVASTQHLPPNPTIEQVSTYLNISPRTCRRWIAGGLIRAHRLGPRLIRIDRASVEALAKPVGGAR